MERWTSSRKKIEKKKKDDGKSIEEPGRGTVPWISEFPTKSIGYGVVNGRVKGGGEQKATRALVIRGGTCATVSCDCTRRPLVFFLRKNLHTVCRGCTRPRDKRGGRVPG